MSGPMAWRVASLLENGQCSNEMESVAAEKAVARLVRAGDALTECAAGDFRVCTHEWEDALSSLASVLRAQGGA